MQIPDGLLYAKTHEWVRISDGKAQIGLTDYAQDALGDIVFFNLPELGASFAAGEAAGEVESVKAVSEICAPVGRVICAVNNALIDAPELINESPYNNWVFEMEFDGAEEDAHHMNGLLTPVEYGKFCVEAAKE